MERFSDCCRFIVMLLRKVVLILDWMISVFALHKSILVFGAMFTSSCCNIFLSPCYLLQWQTTKILLYNFQEMQFMLIIILTWCQAFWTCTRLEWYWCLYVYDIVWLNKVQTVVKCPCFEFDQCVELKWERTRDLNKKTFITAKTNHKF